MPYRLSIYQHHRVIRVIRNLLAFGRDRRFIRDEPSCADKTFTKLLVTIIPEQQCEWPRIHHREIDLIRFVPVIDLVVSSDDELKCDGTLRLRLFSAFKCKQDRSDSLVLLGAVIVVD